MRAIGVFVHGGPEALEVIDLPEVHAGAGQVRVRVHAAAVNPTDTMVRNGSRAEQQKVDPPPYVPGMDAAGIVDEVDEGVTTGVKVGDQVMAMVVPKGSHGAYREQIVLEARSVVSAPAGTSHVEACTLPMNGLTARCSLDLLGLSTGQSIAVTGAAGAYGGYVVQLAKADGLTVIADASEADEGLVTSLGADMVVRRGDDVASRRDLRDRHIRVGKHIRQRHPSAVIETSVRIIDDLKSALSQARGRLFGNIWRTLYVVSKSIHRFGEAIKIMNGVGGGLVVATDTCAVSQWAEIIRIAEGFSNVAP